MSAHIAIMFFVLFCSSLLLLAAIIPKYSELEWLNTLLKRCCLIIFFYVMALNSAIAATIASAAGLTVTQEMFTFMWIFGQGGYVAMFYTVFKTFLDVTKLWKLEKAKKRAGEDG